MKRASYLLSLILVMIVLFVVIGIINSSRNQALNAIKLRECQQKYYGMTYSQGEVCSCGVAGCVEPRYCYQDGKLLMTSQCNGIYGLCNPPWWEKIGVIASQYNDEKCVELLCIDEARRTLAKNPGLSMDDLLRVIGESSPCYSVLSRT